MKPTLFSAVPVSPIIPFFWKFARRSASSDQRLKKLLQIMPKESNLRHIKQRNITPLVSPSEAFFQIVGDGSPGSPKVVILVTPSSRYLFNCGEGTQRIIQEHKLRLSRVENVFFTTKRWDNIGGLPGLTLTVKDIGVPKLTLHGPNGLDCLYAMNKKFMQMQEIEVDYRSLEQHSYEDHAVNIKYVPLVPDADATVSVMAEDGSNTFPKKRRNSSPRLNTSVDAVAYIGKIADKAGALLFEKCVQLGVPAGPVLSKLKDGLDITLANGKVVKSTDVCQPSVPGPYFVVVECPTEKYIDCLVRNPAFISRQSGAKSDDDLAKLVIHFTPARVLVDPRYRGWINSFSASTHHVFVNDANNNPGSAAVYRIQAMLNMLDGEVFPLLAMQTDQKITMDKSNSEAEKEDGPFIQTSARPLAKYYLRPSKRFHDTESCFVLDNDEYRAEAVTNEGLQEAIDEYQKLFPMGKTGSAWEEPDVIFLGTGSAIPSKVRNTSGILLRLSRDVSFLLDCGEASCGQIFKIFGQKADEELRKIQGIFLSHPHADHHVGLAGMLLARRESFERSDRKFQPVWLMIPEPLEVYLRNFSSSFENLMNDAILLRCGDVQHKRNSEKTDRDLRQNLDLRELQIVDVIHCPFSYGISLSTNDGWKICYSGDTMPCQNLVRIGMNSDLLIHEATMEDGLAEDAVKKRHSTTSQAIEVGRSMRAKFTLLTHFSQRYAKIPLLKEALPTDVGIAFDNMRIQLSKLKRIPQMLPALNLMFTEHVEEMQNRSDRLERRREWEKQVILDRPLMACSLASSAV